MSPPPKKGLAVGALLSVMLACAGCALTAAAVAPAVTGTFPVVAENRGGGRADSFWVARYEDVVAAVLRAGEKLSLDLEEEEREETRTQLRYTGGRNMEVEIRIDFWTDTVTRVQLDVGSSRFSSFARLLGQQVRDELSDADAFLVDWSVEQDTDEE